MDIKDLKFVGLKRKVDSVGRLFLPRDIREMLGMVPGTTVEVFLVGDVKGCPDGVFIKVIKESED